LPTSQAMTFRSPCARFRCFSSIVEENDFDNLSDKGKEYFRRIQNAAGRMQTLINDLLSFSRAVNSEKTFELTEINTIINEVREDLAEDLQEKNAMIHLEGRYAIDLIPFQFRQMLYNLVGNSLKFSNPDVSPIIKISAQLIDGVDWTTLGLDTKTRYCQVTVTDNGIGFDPKYSSKIFEMFQSLHLRSEYKGTGLGLAIVKKIVDNHRGIIHATSELNVGTRFDIYFPVTQA
jgi:signal transduction histidine kinase